MADMLSYRTLQHEGSDEIIINKSRFIGYGTPCQTEEEALAFLNRIRQKHQDATHNCYAYIIGQNAGIMRYSDDGEPGGTAGMPIIEVLKNRRLVNCAVVVTRYFGGVLLGAGGLVRAYTQGCKIATDASTIVVMRRSEQYMIEVDYSTWQRLSHYLQGIECQILHNEFGVNVVTTLLIRADQRDDILESITRLSDGQAEILPDGISYSAWPDPSDDT